MYLVLAIGLVLQPHSMSIQTDGTFNTLSPSHIDHAELLFRSAKFLGECVSGFENGDLWSVQALCLMGVYQMMVSRWNAAYVYIGEQSTHITLGCAALTYKQAWLPTRPLPSGSIDGKTPWSCLTHNGWPLGEMSGEVSLSWTASYLHHWDVQP